MKSLIVMGALALTVTAASAQQDFKGPLKATWDALDTTKMPDDQAPLANKLALISKKWAGEWSTHFYVALSKTYMSYGEKDEAKHDAILDEADKELDEAVSLLGKPTDETWVVAAMIANSRMMVNPMQRWQKYGKTFSDDLDNAKEINPENPRMYYLKGVTTFFTPKNFGGGKKNAQPYFEKATTFFAKEDDKDITRPYWGKARNAYFLAECAKPDKE
jgi:hypothetical protein